MGGLYKGAHNVGVNVCVPKDEKDSKGTEFGIIYLTMSDDEFDQKYNY